jgi:hypothetical protein
MRQFFKIFAAIIGAGAYIEHRQAKREAVAPQKRFLATTLSDLRAADEKRPPELSAAEEQADFNKRPR